MAEKKIKIIVAKPGLDGHDRGAKLLSRIFAEAGMEVVYTGLRQTPEMIVEAALQEDADVVGLSSELKKAGIAEIFGPGTSTEVIVDFIKSNVKAK